MISYERMVETHVPQIARLETQCFSDPWSEKSIASELENPLSLWLVALSGDTVVGYVGSQSVLGEADMMNIAVDEACRRQGIGKNLVLNLVEQLKEQGIHSLSLEVRQSNAPAIALYEEMGFQQVGLRPNYYRNPKENAMIFRKEWTV